MYIQANIKCDRQNTPYRVYINGELITERFYTASRQWQDKDKITKTWNSLRFEIADSEDYNVQVELVPGYPKAKLYIDNVEWQETPYEDT